MGVTMEWPEWGRTALTEIFDGVFKCQFLVEKEAKTEYFYYGLPPKLSSFKIESTNIKFQPLDTTHICLVYHTEI